MMLRLFLLTVSAAFLFSCEPIVNSIVKESAEDVDQKSNEVFEETEFVANDSFSVLEKKPLGQDTLRLIRAYFEDGKKNFESWQINGIAHGVTRFFYHSGRERHSLVYNQGMIQNLLTSFDPYGRKVDGGNLKNGSGNIIVYHPYTGKIQYEVEYLNSRRHGKFNAYFSNGKIGQKAMFVNDTLSGPYFKYYRSGKTHSKGAFDVRSQTGFLDMYYANGNLRQHDDYRHGEVYASTEYDLNGTITSEKTTVDGQLVTVNYFYGGEGRILSKEQMIGEKRHGTFEYFYENGAKKSREHYRNDTIQSDTIWFSSGSISATSLYCDGRKHGLYREYYPTGTLRVEQMYANGVEEGMYKSYFANGKLYNEGQFKNGELSGDLEFYSDKGVHTHTKHYN